MAAVTAATVFVVVGHASGIGVSSSGVGVGRSSVSGCDTNGVSVVQVLTGTNVTGVTVGGIDAACAGGSLSATVNNGTTTGTGTASVPGGGGTVTLGLSSSVAFRDADEIDVSIAGP